MSGQPRFILLARFRLQPQALNGLQVKKLDFVWQDALNEFMDTVAQIRSKEINYKELPPYRRLNSALISAAPQLVHAFERTNITQASQKPLRSTAASRQMLALVREGSDLPAPTQLNTVVTEWAKQWAQANFNQVLEGPQGRDFNLLKQLLENLDLATQKATWQQMAASAIWQDLNNPLLFQAVPSLLANMLRGQISRIKGKDIVWQLAQNPARTKLVLVSTPQISSFTKKPRSSDKPGLEVAGTFAYSLEFAVQTQAGNPEPWIHLYLGVRRYPDKPLKKINFGRNVTVMVGATRERLQGWGIDPTLVPIPVSGPVRNMSKVVWANSLAALLGDLRVRSLAEPKDIFADPLSYRRQTPEQGGDVYLPLFAEGMSPASVVRSGFGSQERAETVASIADLLQGVLVADVSLEADKIALKNTFSPTLAGQKELKKKQIQISIAERISYALNGKPLQIVSFWYSSRTRDRVRQELGELFGITNTPDWSKTLSQAEWEKAIEPLQAHNIQVVEQAIAPNLVGALNPGGLKPTDHFNAKRAPDFYKSWEQQMKLARTELTAEWEKVWLSLPALAKTGNRLVLIEAVATNEDQSPKSVLRKTALRTGKAGSQLIWSVKAVQDAEKNPTAIDRSESIWRVKNGVADLLLRQTGALLDSPFGIYHNQAKLPEELAKDLTVVGLYRRRTINPNIDYAMAVRISPEGHIEACLPGLNAGATKWLPYLVATGEVGRLFADKSNVGKNLKLPAETLLEFLRLVLLPDTQKPTLVMAMADQWRSGVWPQLTNAQLHKNQLNLNNPKLKGIGLIQTLTPLELPNLRVLRLRQKGSLGETPQYVATFPNKTWQDAEATKLFGVATGFEDTSANSELFHYLSVTKLPVMSRGQKGASVGSAKREKGGDIPFKYQSVLEIVPFFLQKDDNPIQWARIAHFLRKSPAWRGGGLLFPYPIHLAHTAINDQLCMLE